MRRQPNIFLASGFSEADKANMKAQQKKIETQKGFLMDYTYAQASADAGVGVPEWRNISWDVWMRLCRDGTPEANWKRNEKKSSGIQKKKRTIINRPVIQNASWARTETRPTKVDRKGWFILNSSSNLRAPSSILCCSSGVGTIGQNISGLLSLHFNKHIVTDKWKNGYKIRGNLHDRGGGREQIFQ